MNTFSPHSLILYDLEKSSGGWLTGCPRPIFGNFTGWVGSAHEFESMGGLHLSHFGVRYDRRKTAIWQMIWNKIDINTKTGEHFVVANVNVTMVTVVKSQIKYSLKVPRKTGFLKCFSAKFQNNFNCQNDSLIMHSAVLVYFVCE